MKKAIKVVTVIIGVAFCVAGCTKPDVSNNGGIGTYNGHEYVDLGLPSGTLWATCNIGAKKPDGFGDYYAWGEKTTKSTYDWENYQHCNGRYYRLTKYCTDHSYGNDGFTDFLTEIRASDDVARSSWGIGWRIPSKKQWDELKSNTTVTWTTQNGTNGLLFSASNGNVLFLPAAGLRYFTGSASVGSFGFYYSRTLYIKKTDMAWCLRFFSEGCKMSSVSREEGLSIRPVLEK